VSPQSKPEITVMIGPEGDFSRAEVALALERGWQPVSLGDSRLRIETAALVATAAVYLNFFAT
jgi:16S rRNA (uracil1498-N3)-methyltransferase